eukprot:6544281-Pyramimonas_sp.AAC.1
MCVVQLFRVPRAASPASDAFVCRRKLGESPRLRCPCARRWLLAGIAIDAPLQFHSTCCVAVTVELARAHAWAD